ncbi:MAG: periplasmic sensor signal transduction histidine kinase [Candidatus Ozemobacter sibiricus]|uniref:histidine kinase n=1 Tax=Candidatus Ozemobacter sibiricus TaxID=2268124 RepID=A0A367ZTD6_9BACT|nr:MAG: periplasmic sensor signal transduction histidine kinase [Candidatus Ozemobacter sibiricus]
METPTLPPVPPALTGGGLLLGEIAQVIGHLSPDRGVLFLLERALEFTQARGGLVLIPHEKLREMVPLLENLPSNGQRPTWEKPFLEACYKVFLDGHTLFWDREILRQHGFQSPCPDGCIALVLPIKLAGRPVALLFIYRCAGGLTFTSEHQNFLEMVTPFMGTLIENFLMHTEMIHKNSRLSALYEISQRTESLIDLRDVYESLGKVVQSFIDYDAYVLHLLAADGKTLEARKESATGGFPLKIALGEGPIGKAAQEMKPHLTYTADFNSVLILPIVVSGKLVGVVTIASKKPYAYRDEDIIGLRIITTQIGSVDQLFKDLVRLRGFTQHILESMNSGVLIFDTNGLVSFVNSEMTRLLGQPLPEGWSLQSSSLPIPGPLAEVIASVLERKVTLENTRIRLEETHPPKTLEVTAFPFRDEHGLILGTACFVKDITQIIRLEDQLKRADRLSALGVLAAGIAHEIRNPLTGIKMIVQLQVSELQPGDPRREPIEIIQREIERLERIIVNLLDFARPSKPKAVQVILPEVVEACLLLLQNQLKKAGLRLEREFPPEIPPLIGDPDQLKQVFLNILTNAIQASHQGGRLRISMEVRPGWVATAIQDTGVGIPQEWLRAIFDPFMTTKEDGTGLGLPLAQRIVDEHGGRIDVDSVLGVGSTFTVHLPLRPEAEVGAPHA